MKASPQDYDTAKDPLMCFLTWASAWSILFYGIGMLVFERWMGFLVFLLGLSLLGILYLFTKPIFYNLQKDNLRVCSGVIHWIIPYQRIRTVKRVVSWSSAPALSKNRLEIRYAHLGKIRKIQISPLLIDTFEKELTLRINRESRMENR